MTEYVDEIARRAGRERRLDFDGPRNFRDLGGYATGDGRTTRWGVLYRADALDRMTPSDLDRFAELGIVNVYDLRHDFERERGPNPMPSVNISVMSRVVGDAPPNFADMVTADHGREFMRNMMLRLIEHAGAEFGELVRRLSDPSGVPAVYHCTAGKDRTGVLTALVLESVGVDRDTVLDDFTLTDRYRAVSEDSDGFAMMVERGAPPEVATAALGAPRELLGGVLDEIDRRWGGVRTYLAEQGDVDDATIASLRSNLLD